MTLIDDGDDVVYEVALCEFPVVANVNDDRTDEELIEAVESQAQTADDIDWPEWNVRTIDTPDGAIRHVDTETRINVLGPYGIGGHKTERDVFDEIDDRLDIDDFDPDMSHWGATHPDDFDGEIHLDVTN